MNKDILDAFMRAIESKKVLEMGLKGTIVETLKKVCTMRSFDMKTSLLRFNPKAMFKQKALVKLPYADGEFDGCVSYKILGYGDAAFLFEEISRVTRGSILIAEDDIEAMPIDYFSTRDDMVVDCYSKDGEFKEVGTSMMEFFSRRDIRNLFSSPGSSINKFNLLVPEDLKVDVCILCRRGEIKDHDDKDDEDGKNAKGGTRWSGY